MSIDYKGANDLAAKAAALSQRISTNASDIVAKSTALSQRISTNASDISELETKCDGKQEPLTSLAGYDSSKTQVLKNIEGVLTWVTEDEEESD